MPFNVPERNLAPLLLPRHPFSRLVCSIWGKGFQWAFEQGLFLVVDKKRMELKGSSDPSHDAVRLQDRLTTGTSSRIKPKKAPILVMSNEALDLVFPCGKDRILVRDAYYEAYDQCMKSLGSIGGTNSNDSAPGVLLTGHPGIGKSVFLSFCLVVRLLQALPTAYQDDQQDNVLLLTGDGCFDIYKSRHLTTMDKERKNVVALCDSLPVRHIMGVSCYRHWPILFVSSPKEEEYKSFVKSKEPEILYMDLCSRQELRILNSALKVWGERFSGAEFEDIFNRYHPTPRFLNNIAAQKKTTSTQYLIHYDRQVIAKAVTIIGGSMATLRSESFWLDTGSQTIAVLRPSRSDDTDDFVLVSSSSRKTIPTTYTWLLLSRAAAEIRKWGMVKRLFRMIHIGEVKTGMLQESVWKNYCRERLITFPDDCILYEPLPPANGTPGQPALQSFSFTLGTRHIPFVDAENLAAILNDMKPSEVAGKLFVPLQRDFPTLDFLFFDFIPGEMASTQKDTLRANLLQTTVLNSHSVKSVGIVHAAAAIPPRLRNITDYPPRLITLVPDPQTFQKTPQAQEAPSKTTKEFALVAAARSWLKTVPQYVAAWAPAWDRPSAEASLEIAKTNRFIADTYQQKANELEADLNTSKKRTAGLKKEVKRLRKQVGAQEALREENTRLKDELNTLKEAQAKIEEALPECRPRTGKRSRNEFEGSREKTVSETSVGIVLAGQGPPSKLARRNSEGRKKRRSIE